MNKAPEKLVVLFDSPEAAQLKTVTGWVSRDGRFFGNDENSARIVGSTHVKCTVCEKVTKNSGRKCDECAYKYRYENYLKLPYEEYAGQVTYEWDGDKYFFNEEDIEDYMEENELTEIDLLVCEENNWKLLDSEYWQDEMPEECDDIPKVLQEAIDNLNKVLQSLPAQSYSPDKIRTKYILKNDKTDEAKEDSQE